MTSSMISVPNVSSDEVLIWRDFLVENFPATPLLEHIDNLLKVIKRHEEIERRAKRTIFARHGGCSG